VFQAIKAVSAQAAQNKAVIYTIYWCIMVILHYRFYFLFYTGSDFLSRKNKNFISILPPHYYFYRFGGGNIFVVDDPRFLFNVLPVNYF